MTINDKNQKRYTAMADLAESDTPLPTAMAPHGRREEDPGYGQRFLEAALGDATTVERAIVRGRPPLGALLPGEKSPVIRARIDPETDAKISEIEAATHKSRSELVREAMDLLLKSYETPTNSLDGLLSRISGLAHDAAEISKIAAQLEHSR